MYRQIEKHVPPSSDTYRLCSPPSTKMIIWTLEHSKLTCHWWGREGFASWVEGLEMCEGEKFEMDVGRLKEPIIWKAVRT
jgi:hypothetical protein